jgi:hypothetical protein
MESRGGFEGSLQGRLDPKRHELFHAAQCNRDRYAVSSGCHYFVYTRLAHICIDNAQHRIYKGRMKKLQMVCLRTTEGEQDAFRAACSAAGVPASAVIRDLCKAAVPYMERYCKNGRWYPPRLVPDVPEDAGHGITQVVNGHRNHVRANSPHAR